MGTRIEGQRVALAQARPQEELSSSDTKAAEETLTSNKSSSRTTGDKVESKRSSAADVLNTLGRAAAKHRRDRKARKTPLMNHPGTTAGVKGGIHLGEKVLHHVGEHGMKGLAKTGAQSALRRAAFTASSVLAGIGAGLAAIEGLKVGLEQIVKAHEKGHQFGIRTKASKGLAHVLRLATAHPKMSIAQLRQKVTGIARGDYSSELAAIKKLRGGQARSKDLRELKAEYEGYRKGMEAGLALIGKLSATQRQALGKAAVQRSGESTVKAAIERLAKQATGADSIHGGS
jgi:hypothetical protein